MHRQARTQKPYFRFGSLLTVTGTRQEGPESGALLSWLEVGQRRLSFKYSLPMLAEFASWPDKPDTSLVFQFPMLLAPNFTVPLFALAHVFALVRLFAT